MDTAISKQKNKVLHTCNNFNNILVKYEDPDGNIAIKELWVDWYFAINEKDLAEARKLQESTNLDIHFIIDSQFPAFVQVHYDRRSKNQPDRDQVVLKFEEKGIETFEGDLMPDRRWYIDREVEVASKYRKLYFDIETDDTNTKIRIGKDRILSYAAIDSDGNKFFYSIEKNTNEAEIQLLQNFASLIENYDLLLGWNSSEFDIPYIKERMAKYEIKANWKMIGKFDLLKRFRHIFRFDSHIRTFSLDYIAHHFLDKGKVPHSEKIIDLWKYNKEKLRLYNEEDSLLVKELDEKLGVSAMMIKQSQWCGVPATKFGLYTIIDAHIMRTAHRNGKFCKTSVRAIKERNLKNQQGNEDPNDTHDQKYKRLHSPVKEKAKYTGAIVLEPKTGVYSGVYVFDFKGLYPSMMRTSNIGYDTLRYEANDQNYIINPGTLAIKRKLGGIRPTYFEKAPSVINLAISELIVKRSEYKKLKLKMIEEGTNKGPKWESVVSDEIIVKELSNSTYGIMGLEYGRYFSVDVAESITLFGQWCITFAKKFFESLGYLVIYGDTDSVFVVAGKEEMDYDERLNLFHTALKKELNEKYNIDTCFIELEFDKRYETLILIEKKTYVGHVTNIERKKTDDIYARGLEYHKKNTFSYAAKKQKELIDLVLYKHPGKDEIQEWLWSTRDGFFAKEFTKDDLMIIQKVGRNLEDYTGKTPPLHVRLAMELKEKNGGNFRNTEIEYIITNHTGKMNGVLAENFDGKFDREYYWSNKTQPLLERIANVVCPGYDWFNPTLSLF